MQKPVRLPGLGVALFSSLPISSSSGAGSSVAVTRTFPSRNSAGSGKCRVPSTSASRMTVIVLIHAMIWDIGGRGKQVVASVAERFVRL